jgi:succinyl-CoA synthetase beta subunit
MARPKKSKESKLEFYISVRLDETEKSKVAAEAKKAGITVSAYARAKLLKGYVHINEYAKVDTVTINQLSKLGGLMKHFHKESGGLYSQKTASVLDDMKTITLTIRGNLSDDWKTHREPQDT